jgi:hypothetical protein
MNERGGKNNEEFERYIDNSIILLFPDLEEHQGSVSCSRLTAAAVDIGGTCSTSVGSGVFTLTPACPTLPLCRQQETDINFYGPFKGVVWRNLDKIAMTCYTKEITMSLGVGTLPDGYVRTNPLSQVPTKQSVQTSRICLPPYFGLPIVIPALRMIVGPTIARARIPW